MDDKNLELEYKKIDVKKNVANTVISLLFLGGIIFGLAFFIKPPKKWKYDDRR